MTETGRSDFESEPEIELANPLLDFARDSLGLVESESMRQARLEAIAASEGRDDGQFVSNLGRYQELAQQDQDAGPPEDIDHLTLARAVASAEIYHAAGKPTLYREELTEAIDFARNMGFTKEVQRLNELQLEVFKQDYQKGLDDFEPQAEFSLPADPFSLRSDSPTFDTLSLEELVAARQVLFPHFGITPEKEDEMVTRRYKSQTDERATVPGEIEVTVYQTNLEGYEGVFLQELILPDGKPSWMVGPDEDI